MTACSRMAALMGSPVSFNAITVGLSSARARMDAAASSSTIDQGGTGGPSTQCAPFLLCPEPVWGSAALAPQNGSLLRGAPTLRPRTLCAASGRGSAVNGTQRGCVSTV